MYLERIRNVIFENDQYDTLYVRDLMSNPPAVIQLSDSMQKVIETFNETDAWNLPVIDNGCYVGFISKSKLFGEYRKQLIDITED